MGFEENEFQNAFAEISKVDFEGYEKFTESHGVTLYRQYSEVISL